MKLRSFTLMLAICFFLTLSACSKTASTVTASSPESSAEPQTFGTTNIETAPVQEAQTTTLPEDSTISESATAAPQEPSASTQDLTAAAVTAAIICDAVDMLPYAPEDPMYLWRSVGYCIGQAGTDSGLVIMDGDFGKVSQDIAPLFAYAMDGNFSGELPSVTEEDPLIAMAEDGGYLINMLSQGDLELKMTENRLSSDGNTFTEEAELFRDGNSLGVYTVTLTAYTGPAEGRAYFPYSITDISPK